MVLCVSRFCCEVVVFGCLLCFYVVWVGLWVVSSCVICVLRCSLSGDFSFSIGVIRIVVLGLIVWFVSVCIIIMLFIEWLRIVVGVVGFLVC